MISTRTLRARKGRGPDDPLMRWGQLGGKRRARDATKRTAQGAFSRLLSQKTKEERLLHLSAEPSFSVTAAFVSIQRFSARDARLVTAPVQSASEGDVICLFVSNHGCRAALARVCWDRDLLL